MSLDTGQLMLLSVETEMKVVGLGRAQDSVEGQDKELRSGSLKCLWLINVEVSRRLLRLGRQSSEFFMEKKKWGGEDLKECVNDVNLRKHKQ